jgi:hypothetical protein
VRRGRGTDDGMQRPGAMQMASRAGGCEQGDDGRAGKDVEVRAGYLGRRNAMRRVSGRFYIGAGARAQGEGGVQKKQIGTGARLVDFYRTKHPGLA